MKPTHYFKAAERHCIMGAAWAMLGLFLIGLSAICLLSEDNQLWAILSVVALVPVSAAAYFEISEAILLLNKYNSRR